MINLNSNLVESMSKEEGTIPVSSSSQVQDHVGGGSTKDQNTLQKYERGNSTGHKDSDITEQMERDEQPFDKTEDASPSNIQSHQNGTQSPSDGKEGRKKGSMYKDNVLAEREIDPDLEQSRSAFRHCFWRGTLDSQDCPVASLEDISDILHHCYMILGAYGKDIDELAQYICEHDPRFEKKSVIAFEHPLERGACPPYFICVDHHRQEVGMYIRGLNLLHRQDYVTLMRNRKGEQPYDGGYVHYGMMRSAEWTLKCVAPTLKQHLLANSGYRLVIAGHSLGAGVAAIFTLLLLKNPEAVGGISIDNIKGYAIEPPRVMSLNLAMQCSPHMCSVVYQDDFLPRVSTSAVKRLFLAAFPFTLVVISFHWVKQALQPKNISALRLYPPGCIFHAVYKQPGIHHHVPIKVRFVESVKGRFERLVLSASATTRDHSVLHLVQHLKTYKPADGTACLGIQLNLKIQDKAKELDKGPKVEHGMFHH